MGCQSLLLTRQMGANGHDGHDPFPQGMQRLPNGQPFARISITHKSFVIVTAPGSSSIGQRLRKSCLPFT